MLGEGKLPERHWTLLNYLLSERSIANSYFIHSSVSMQMTKLTPHTRRCSVVNLPSLTVSLDILSVSSFDNQKCLLTNECCTVLGFDIVEKHNQTTAKIASSANHVWHHETIAALPFAPRSKLNRRAKPLLCPDYLVFCGSSSLLIAGGSNNRMGGLHKSQCVILVFW